MAQTSRYAIISLILGIASISLFWIYGVGIVLGILAIVFGILALKQIKKEKLAGKGMAIGGIITGCVPLILLLAIGILAYYGVSTPVI